MLTIIENDTLPNALMIGVDYELFWTLNPKSLSPFIKAFSLKQKYDDAMLWKAGLYVRMAIGSAMSKDNKYPTAPLSSQEVVEHKEVDKLQEMKNRFMTHVVAINSRFGKET